MQCDAHLPEEAFDIINNLGVGQRELEAQGDPTLAPGVEGHAAPKGGLSEDDQDPIDGVEQGATVTSPDGDDARGTDVSGGPMAGAPD